MRRIARKVCRYANVLWHWQVRKNTKLPYLPEDISIEVTNSCNFACEFCPQSSPHHFDHVPRTMLSAEKAATLLKKIRDGGVKTDVIHWTLDGEPFVNKKFHEICSVAIDHGFTNMIFSTNGSIATKERLQQLPHNPGVKYTLCIDYCSDKEYFESVRGRPGSWDDVEQNVSALLDDNDLSHIHVKLTDISCYKFSEKEELEQRFKDLKKLFCESERVDYGVRVFHNATGYVEIAGKSTSAKYHLCPYPWTSLVIGSNGDVVVCCRDLEHKTVLGNLFTEDLAEIWNGEAAQRVRSELSAERPESIKACKGCDLPYDDTKFGVKNLASTAVRRLQIFS